MGQFVYVANNPSEFQISSFKTYFSYGVSYVILTLALHTPVARLCVFHFVLIINAADDDGHVVGGRGLSLWLETR